MDIESRPQWLIDHLKDREIPGSEIQCSDAWFASRVGKITGSGLYNITTENATKSTALPQRAIKYIKEKVKECLTGVCHSIEDNDYMRWGRETEPEARAFAEAYLGVEIYETGALRMPWSDDVQVSPDGIGMDKEGRIFIFETKSPSSDNHLGYMMENKPKVPGKYKAQVQGEIEAAGAEYGIFLTYDPRMGAHSAMILKVEIDEAMRDRIKENSLKALERIEQGAANVRKNSCTLF